MRRDEAMAFLMGSIVRPTREHENRNGNALLHKDIFRVIRSDRHNTIVKGINGNLDVTWDRRYSFNTWSANTHTWELAYDKNDIEWWIGCEEKLIVKSMRQSLVDAMKRFTGG